MLVKRRWDFSVRDSCRKADLQRTASVATLFTKLRRRRNAMTMGMQITGWALAAVSAVMLSGIANAAEIKVIGSPGTREPYSLLVPGFWEATGHKGSTTWGGVTAVAKRGAGG